MFNKEEMEEMTRKAKEQIKKDEEVEDIYASLREEVEEGSENYNEGYDKVERYPIKNEELPKIDTNKENAQDYYPHEEDENFSKGDYRLFEGGPYLSEVQSWKKQFELNEVYVTEIQNNYFIFRTLNRFEYKQIVARANIDGLQREEIICETVVLWPEQFTWKEMAIDKAGLPSSLSEIIMKHSGFTSEYQVSVI